ncbi:MAG: hypothetical protein M0Q48_06525 [Verrucomicrobia bacterium]|nr:hypothetical protein [Verrucomicrobiota bacterium]
MQQKQLFCKRCNQPRLYQRNGTRHLFHLVMTVVLFAVSAQFLGILGFAWMFIWALCTIFKDPYRCTQCGSKEGSSHLLAALILGIMIFLACAVLLGHSWHNRRSSDANFNAISETPGKILVPSIEEALNPDAEGETTNTQAEYDSGSSNGVYNPYNLKLETLLKKKKEK